jgi:hypothetical protein
MVVRMPAATVTAGSNMMCLEMHCAALLQLANSSQCTVLGLWCGIAFTGAYPHTQVAAAAAAAAASAVDLYDLVDFHPCA